VLHSKRKKTKIRSHDSAEKRTLYEKKKKIVEKRATMTLVEREAYKEKQRQRFVEKRATMTLVEREAHKEKQRQRFVEIRATRPWLNVKHTKRKKDKNTQP
jgi:hypothetical protein